MWLVVASDVGAEAAEAGFVVVALATAIAVEDAPWWLLHFQEDGV